MARFNHDLLRAVRLDLGLGQDELARALGVDVRTYRRYESGAVNEAGAFEVRNASRRRILLRMCQELGVADEQAWLVPEAAARGGAARGHALQRAKHFVGRAEVLRQLDEVASDQQARVLQVIGVGGAGKTAVVERFVTKLRSKTWTHSFYDDPRTEAVVEELTRARGPLVVLDGLETVQSTGGHGRAFGELDDPALRRVLRAVCSGLCKRRVVVTSRFPLTDLAEWEGDGLTTLALAPLSRDESKSLLRAWGIRGDDAAVESLCERTGGHALSTAMLGSYAGTFLDGDAARAVSIPGDAADDDRTARRLASVLGSYAASLAEHERQLLARLSLFAGAADVALLAGMAGIAEGDVIRTVARLDRLGLVARGELGVTAHPFVREHFKQLLGVPEADAHAAIRDALGATLEGKPATHVRDAALLDRYEALFEHTLRSKRPEEALGIYTRALGGFANLGLRVGAMTRGARVLSSFSRDGAPETLEPALTGEMRASVLYDWGLYAGALGDLRLAERCHALRLASLDDVHPQLARALRAMGLRTRSYVAWLTGNHGEARTFVRASLESARAIDDERGSRFHLARGFAFEAMVEHDAGDREAALRALAAARAIEAVPTARRALWEAEIRLDHGEGETARSLATEALTDCARRGWIGHVAHAHTVLGLAIVGADPVTARRHLELARPWVDASNEVEMSLRCQLLAARVERRTKRGSEGGRAVDAGLLLARTHGFERFTRLFET